MRSGEHASKRGALTCSMTCICRAVIKCVSSGLPKGYCADSITYSITPHDHTSAACMCIHSCAAQSPQGVPIPQSRQAQAYACAAPLAVQAMLSHACSSGHAQPQMFAAPTFAWAAARRHQRAEITRSHHRACSDQMQNGVHHSHPTDSN